MINRPKISVIIPINRDDGFFNEAVESILNQSFKDFELIIVANNCEDKLWYEINTIKDIRVKKIRIEMGGLSNALNYGIQNSVGKYIARMDADDISIHNRLSSQFIFMENNLNVDILGTKIKLINKDGNIIPSNLKFYQTDYEIKKIMPFRNPMAHPSILIRRDVIIKSGGYKYDFTGEDYELWIRLMLEDKVFHNLSQELLLYRRHEKQMTDTNKLKANYYKLMSLNIHYYLITKQIIFLFGAILKHPYMFFIYKFFNK